MGPRDPGFSVRPARAGDVEPLLRVKAQSWREAYGALLPADVLDRAEAGVPDEAPRWVPLIDAGHRLAVAEDSGGRIVGMALEGPLRPEAPGLPARELKALYVLERFHGAGVGAALLEAVLQEGPAVLHVLTENPRARAFYRRHGFVDEGPPQPLGGDWRGLHEQRMVRRG